MDTFEKLDRLAKQTGRTYQDIQADAIRAYLAR
jgi:predicted transcriptional regulator